MPLFMIKEQPDEGQLTTITINHTKGFRYIRYIWPDNSKCNIAEVVFYGYPGQGDNSTLYQLTSSPTLIVSDLLDVTELTVYSHTGQLVYRGIMSQSGEIILPRSGLYVVHRLSGSQRQVQKIMVL